MKLFNFWAWIGFAGGLFFGAIFVLAGGFTLTTTQLLFMDGIDKWAHSSVSFTYDVAWQLVYALQGAYSGEKLEAVIWSWCLLSCYVAASSMKKWIKHGIAHEGVEMFCHVMIALDGFANWVYLSGKPWYYQLLFSIGIAMALMHFGKISIGCFKYAVAEFTED